MLHEVPDTSGYSRSGKAAEAGTFAFVCARMFKVRGTVCVKDDIVDALTLVAMSAAGSEDGTADSVEVLSGLAGQYSPASGAVVSAMVEACLPRNEALLRDMVAAAESGGHMPGSDLAGGWTAVLAADAVLLVGTGIAADAMRLVDVPGYEPMTRQGRAVFRMFPQFQPEPEASPGPGF